MLGVLTICGCTKLHVHNYNDSLVVTITQKTQYAFHTAITLLIHTSRPQTKCWQCPPPLHLKSSSTCHVALTNCTKLKTMALGMRQMAYNVHTKFCKNRSTSSKDEIGTQISYAHFSLGKKIFTQLPVSSSFHWNQCLHCNSLNTAIKSTYVKNADSSRG